MLDSEANRLGSKPRGCLTMERKIGGMCPVFPDRKKMSKLLNVVLNVIILAVAVWGYPYIKEDASYVYWPGGELGVVGVFVLRAIFIVMFVFFTWTLFVNAKDAIQAFRKGK